MEDISEIIEMGQMEMEGALEFINSQLLKIRTGKANPAMLSDVRVDYYGSPTPINQVGNVSVADARMLTVTPWEKSLIPAIEKAIRDANLGLNPTSDGDLVRIPIPALNEERRKQLVRQAKDEGENAKTSIRSIRQKANAQLKKMQKEGFSEDEVKTAEKKIQDLTNNFVNKIEDKIKEKEAQIMTV
ncbi:MAG: ribosome recycling factor [Bacteroidia bacterium]|nr:ribosome recycling factor [Bacteroidia bacterium]